MQRLTVRQHQMPPHQPLPAHGPHALQVLTELPLAPAGVGSRAGSHQERATGDHVQLLGRPGAQAQGARLTLV
jgi:hypothetical protein